MTTTLWRPVGAFELRLVAASAYRRYPPRKPDQPIFYPVCNEAYAARIASEWNVSDPLSGYAGFVTRFAVDDEVAARYPRKVVGGREHEELWVPADEQDAFCDAFDGPIEVTRGWLGARFAERFAWGEVSEPGAELSPPVLARAIRAIVAEPRSGT